ncbi:MAG: hypothetical protein KGM15_06305 [Pseudomonadota bacterium]|nr:hypothetical protein [Pseudomonadota bacterium]
MSALGEILNLDCFSGAKYQKWFDAARGFADANSGGVFNGGIVSPQREHLKLGQYYYRFVSTGMAESRKLGGAWWIDFDTLNTIYSRYREIGDNPNARRLSGSGPAAATFREWLALTYEWNAIQEIVIAPLRARLDAYSGAGRVAQGSHVFDQRAFGYAPHLSYLFGVKQYCVPELYLHVKAAFPNPRIVPFRFIEGVASGEIG